MTAANRVAEVAAAVGDPARAAMLLALMAGRALSAGELATLAGIAPATASAHLARLVAAGLLTVLAQGRHRYFRIVGPAVAQMIEGMMQLAPPPGGATSLPATGPRDDRLRRARRCYDHLAGRLGVAIADALTARGYVEVEDGAGVVTPAGADFLRSVGCWPDDGEQHPVSRRPLCRPCLDWSERRFHLAGRVGAAISAQAVDRGWVRQVPDSRALDITPNGRRWFARTFGVAEI